MKVGDWGFITGSDMIHPEKWKSSFPQDWFGRVINIERRFSPFDGRKLPIKITVKCYRKGAKPHIMTTKKYFKLKPSQ